MTIDEIEKLASDLAEDDTGGTNEREWNLAHALLAVLPVVRAAEEWRKTMDFEASRAPGEVFTCEHALYGAIDEMRRVMTEAK